MVTIFARKITDDLTSLVKEVDQIVEKNEDQKMAAFVVLLTEDQTAAAKELKELAEKQKIKHTPLTTFDGTGGPKNYKIAEDAEVTVLMWENKEVKANHAFRKGALDKKAIQKIVKDTAKIGAKVESGKKDAKEA